MNKENTYKQSIDFYWKAIVIFFLIQLIYSIAAGSIVEGKITIKLFDPVVLLLSIIITISFISMAFRFLKKKAIVTGSDYIVFKTRRTERTVKLNEIEWIKFSRQMIFNSPNKIVIVKIKLISRTKSINIRVPSFDNADSLLKDLETLKKKIKHV